MSKKSTKRPPRFAEWFLCRMSEYEALYSSVGDFAEEYHRLYSKASKFRAKFWYRSQVLHSFIPYLMLVIYWRIAMFKNYWKVAFRNLWKRRGYSLINILGLSAGIACCIFILFYIQFELSYDSYHKDADRIYRVAKSRKSEAKHDLIAANVTQVAPTLKERFPEVEAAARAGRMEYRHIKINDVALMKDVAYMADPEIFDIFKAQFIIGNKETALARPDAIVLTEHTAQKYFGDEYPIGKTITLDTVICQVTAVIQDCPPNTHLKFDMLTLFQYDENHPFHRPWGGWHCMNYIKLKEGVNFEAFQEKIRYLPHEYIGESLQKQGAEFTLLLQPIEDIHLYSYLTWEAEPPGNPLYIYIFTAVGIFILLITCINFINLTTARSANRSAEVGMRKVVGAQRRQLISQFLGESLIISALAFLCAMIIVFILLPPFNNFADTQFNFSHLFNPIYLLVLLGLMLFIGVIGGGYPAFFLSSFKPAIVLRGALKSGTKGSLMRKVLVVGQFAISITLIIGTMLFYQQLNYMKNQHPGFDKEQKLILEFDRSIINQTKYESVKTEFLGHPSITGATFSSSVPGRWMYTWMMHPFGEEATNSQMINCFQADYDFFPEYDIELIDGRMFRSGSGADRPGSVWIINEAGMNAFGWSDPEVALTKCIGSEDDQIIGVAKNFHFRGLQSTVDPLLIYLMVDDFRYLSLKVNTENLDDIFAFIDNTYQELFPNTVYEYFFLDSDFEKQYRAEEQLSRIFSLFAFFGIFIACLGLFGLASFIAEQRTKEIGIRKVLGASVLRIVYMLSKEFVKWVMIATVLAWPVAWIGMNYWLQDFAYRIHMNFLPFILSGILALAIAILTVSYQTFKAGRSNPVESLNYE